MKMKYVMPMLAMAGIALAEGMVIPPDQPICRLYNVIQLLGSVGGVLAAAYGGFILATSHELTERNNSKMLISGAIIGVVIIWLAPLLIQYLVGSASVCGW